MANGAQDGGPLAAVQDSPRAQDRGAPAYRLRNCRSASVPAIILASPHSGRAYPADFLREIVCDERQLRRAEDAWMDRIAGRTADTLDLPLIAAHWGRTYLDLNRAPGELDPRIVEGAPPVPATNDRLRAGLGIIPRVATPGVPLYDRALSLVAARRRIDAVHRTYHGALERLIARARSAHRHVLLIDCHSMPPLRTSGGSPPARIVIGDRWGSSCDERIAVAAEQEFAKHFRTVRNEPYAGGYTTEHYADPGRGIHALQIEIDRSLYMDLGTLMPMAGLASVADRLLEAVTAMAAKLPDLDDVAVAAE